MAQHVLGIDLGTTNSVVAVAPGRDVRVLADPQGRCLVPSVVSFHPNGGVLVGFDARERRIIDAKNTIYSVKRLIGRPFRSAEVREAVERFPFELRESPSGGVLVAARGRTYALEEISAFVLRQVRAIATRAIGEVRRAVITVPANFNELQRQATKAAGQIAGLDVVRILNEPTAAALAYGYGSGRRERVAIFDLGGGTFDVTIMELAGDVFEVIASAGDSYLGGDDVDVYISERMADEFIRQHRYDLRADSQAYERLRAAAEWAKCRLTDEREVQLRIEELAYGPGGTQLDLRFRISRDELERGVRVLVSKCFDTCEDAMRLAGLRPNQIDNVILAGGSTRMPLIRRMVAEYFGREPLSHIDPDLVVAQGAAIQGRALEGGSTAFIDADEPTQAGKVKRITLEYEKRPQVVGSAAAEPEDPTAPRVTAQVQSALLRPQPSVRPEASHEGLDESDSNAVGAEDGGLAAALEPEEGSTDLGIQNAAQGPISVHDEATAHRSSAALAALLPGLLGATGRQEQATSPLAFKGIPLDREEATAQRAAEQLEELARKLEAGGDEPTAGAYGDLPLPPDPTHDELYGNAGPPRPVASDIEEPTAGPNAAMLAALEAHRSQHDMPAYAPEPETKAVDVVEDEADDWDSGSSVMMLSPEMIEQQALSIPAPAATKAPAVPALPRSEIGAASAQQPMTRRLGPASPAAGQPQAPNSPAARPDLHASSPHTEELSGLDLDAEALRPATRPPASGASAAPRTQPLRARPPAPPPEPPKPPVQASRIAVPVAAAAAVTGTRAMPPAPSPAIAQTMSTPPRASSPPARAPLLLDVTPHALGIETAGGFCEQLVPRNAAIPFEVTRIFSTSQDGQTEVRAKVVQGESRYANENEPLAEIALDELRHAMRGEVQIAVTFIIDADSTLRVTARDLETGRAQAITVSLVASIAQDEIAAMRERQNRDIAQGWKN